MTNKIALREVTWFMADYQPIYQPLYPLFMGKSQAYDALVGTLEFKRLEAVGDLRAKHILPKDSAIQQLSVGDQSKTFKKYFLANQFVQSNLQDQQGNEDIIKQVLDEHQRQMDELFLLGEGTSASTMLNNGLFWSSDANYTLESSKEVKKGTATDHLKDLHTQMMITAAKADQVSGQKALIVYGETATAKFDSLYANTDRPFKTVLGEVLGGNYSLIKMPLDVTPAGVNGWIIANLDQVKLNYTVLPQLKAQGLNEEKMYTWHNFLMGSCMLEVLVKNAVIRQPCTWES